MSEQRERLDVCVMKKAGVSRVLAADLIRNGRVTVNGSVALRPGEKLGAECDLQIDMPEKVYVGRGGYKLEHALDFFCIELAGKICVDIGASTGGFTDCMLQRGAAKVYAIENGKDQLADKLRNDDRVVSFEETNINDLTSHAGSVLPDLRNAADFVSIDVSFVSVTKIIDAAAAVMRSGGHAVLLVKPQFEAGRENISKRGIVRKPGIHEKAVADVSAAARKAGLRVLGNTRSPIEGRDGNIEFLLLCAKP